MSEQKPIIDEKELKFKKWVNDVLDERNEKRRKAKEEQENKQKEEKKQDDDWDFL